MKKLFFVVVFALVGFSCFAQQGIEGLHNLFNSCDAYEGEEYLIIFWDEYTLKDAEYIIGMGTGLGWVKAKPFKNEIEVVFDVVKKHYKPKKGELYSVTTNLSDGKSRAVYIWMNKDNNYYYWVYELEF